MKGTYRENGPETDMNRNFIRSLVVAAMVIVGQDALGQERDARANGNAQVEKSDPGERGTPASFTGEKTAWHGFDRYDFLKDDTKLTVLPFKPSADEGTGINGQVEGQLRCVVVAPTKAVPGKPWSWRGRYFDHEPQAEIEL